MLADCFRSVGVRSILAVVSLGLAALASGPMSVGRAETISIDGGATWTGWTLKGISNRGYLQGPQSPVPGIFGRFSTGSTPTADYEVYSTSFLFNNNSKSGTTIGSQAGSGSTGFGSGTFTLTTGTVTSTHTSFANGNRILGVGVKYVSGNVLSSDRTLRIDTVGNSYLAATTVAANDGRAGFSQWSHQGDYTIQFRVTDFNIASVNSQAGNPYNGGAGFGTNITRTLSGSLGISSFNDKLPFRIFADASSGTATASIRSYQIFVDLDATYQLFGAPNGMGITGGTSSWYPVNNAGDNVTYSLNGWTNVDTAFGAAVVPEPSPQAMAAVSLMVLGAGRLIVRRMRRSRRRAGSSPDAAADLPQDPADPAGGGPAGTG